MDNKRNLFRSALLAVAGSAVAAHASAASMADGVRTYEKVCRYCHEAGVGPVIRGRQLPTEYVKRVVRLGNRAMPSFRATEIDDASLTEVAKLIASSSATTPLGQ